MITTYVDAMGLAAAILTTGSFFPQLVRTWRRGANDISFFMLAMFLAGTFLWFSYGLLLGSLPLILANGVTGLQVLAIAAIKTRDEIERLRLRKAGGIAFGPLEAEREI